MKHSLFCCSVFFICLTYFSPIFAKKSGSVNTNTLNLINKKINTSDKLYDSIALPFKGANRTEIEKIAKTTKEFSRIGSKPIHEMYFVVRKTIETYRYDDHSNTWSMKQEIKTSLDWFELIFHVFAPIFVVVVGMLLIQSVGYLFIRLIFGFQKKGLIILMRKYQSFLFLVLFLMILLIMHYGELEQSLSSTKFLFQQSILIVSGVIGYVLYMRFIQPKLFNDFKIIDSI